MKKKPITPLTPEALYRACNPDDFPFRTSDELEDIDLVVGQERAVDALQFGIDISGNGYNIFALGPAGTGKHTTVNQIVAKIAAEQQPSADWCYVNNFAEPHKPRALKLPPGRGNQLKDDMEQLIEELNIAIPAVFESDEYRSRLEEIHEELKEQQDEVLTKLSDEAVQQGIILIKTPTGFAFAPIQEKDEALNSEGFEKLSDEEKQQIREKTIQLKDKLKKALGQFPTFKKAAKEKIKALDIEIGKSAITVLIETLKNDFSDLPEVVNYLDVVEKDIIKNISALRSQEEENPLAVLGVGASSRGETFHRYQVNLLVDNSDQTSAPVISENLPSHSNLIGRSEYQSHMGTLSTDFTLIKPGALHKANGGYLILDARKILLQPYAWESLKRTLETGEIRIESLERTLSLISTVALEPGPIPIDVKVILVGDRLLYYLFNQYDPDFQNLFKVAADFDDQMDRDCGNNLLYASLIASVARHHGLRTLDKTAVTRLIEHSARLTGDSEKLTTHLRSIDNLLRESDHWAEKAGHANITLDDVNDAINKQKYRSNRIQQRIQEEIMRGTIMINTAGEVVGQVNGLSVMQLGNYAFGSPARITATMRLGSGEVLDIERETKLGGPIHSKGVLILTNFLASRYAKGNPLSMSASIVFEQSYHGVEGDSASLAELCALLSAIANVPVRQSFAITGSINQHGQVQPIGGVNEKIEGYFDVCNGFDLTGDQGVLIPESNVKHLMLREDVVQATREGKFFIYSVTTVDEALELLTDITAGARDNQDAFPEQSVNGRVEKQLHDFAKIRQHFSHTQEEKQSEESK